MNKKQSALFDTWYRLKKNKLAVVSLGVLVFLFLLAIFAPLIAPYDYAAQNHARLFEGPSRDHLLGTDRLGRDVLSRLIYGTRQSLSIGLISIGIAASIGVTLGAVAGYFGKWVDNLSMRFLDVYQSIPMFLLAVTLAAVLGPSLRNAVIALGFSMMPVYARIMRAAVLTVREKEYVEAARAINARHPRIIVRHIVPNTMAPIIVELTMGMGSTILAGAALSFIGLGVQPPIPEWGAMITDARHVMRDAPHLAMFPGIMLMLTVLSFNLLGDGLRDALDPRLKN
jgi:peptide/nickel transport system permease protein